MPRTKKTYSIVEIELHTDGTTDGGKKAIKGVNIIDDVPADELPTYLSSDDPDKRYHLFSGSEVAWKETRTISIGDKKERKPRAPKVEGEPKKPRAKKANGASTKPDFAPHDATDAE